MSNMENYTLGEQKNLSAECPLKIHDNALQMKVSNGSKIKNLMNMAMRRIKEPELRQITWIGQGSAISKVISCAEILKRRQKGLHQITDVRFNRVEEYWEPKLEGLDRLKVNKDVPAITILLSKDDLDTDHPSYQAPGCNEPFLNQMSQAPSKHAGQRQRGRKKGGDNSGQFAAPSMERKRKRRGGGGEGEEGGAKGHKGRNKPKHPAQKDSTKPKPEIDATAAKQASFLDKLEQITKVS